MNLALIHKEAGDGRSMLGEDMGVLRMSGAGPVLVINSGSSSLKFGLFTRGDDGAESVLLDGVANGIGQTDGTLVLRDAAGKEMHSEAVSFGSQGEALAAGLEKMKGLGLQGPVAIGHRVVHGGPKLVEHQLITPEVRATLEASVHFAPLHIPASLKLIDAAEKAYPGMPQYACFDTTFHRTMQESASHLPLPQGLWDKGVRRYGFHGLSYESIVHALGDELPGRLIVAHLGNGCSVTAIRDGASVDTSMGMTPTGGVTMATRTGDLDPGVLLYLMRVKGMDADALEKMLNHDCGLIGLTGSSGDMREIEKAAADGDERARLALEVFDRTVAKTIAGYVSVLGGVDLLVFTGGIGEHSERTRLGVCGRLEFLRVGVKVLVSEEEVQIARHCWRLMGM
jgi:acetate kinase